MGHLIDERIIVVQPSLVRKLGVAAAMVLQQFHWHLQEGHGEEFTDGFPWMRMPYSELAGETGLTPKQVRKAISDMEELDLLLSAQPDGYDRAKWYRIDRTHDLLRSDCPSAPGGRSNGPVARMERPQGADVPSSQTSKNEKNARALAFASFWDTYPRKAGRRKAEAAYRRALERGTEEEILDGLTAHLPSWIGCEPRFIPHPATWLDQDRWLDEPDHSANPSDGFFAYDTGEYGEPA